MMTEQERRLFYAERWANVEWNRVGYNLGQDILREAPGFMTFEFPYYLIKELMDAARKLEKTWIIR
jgi:hypothetical protein